MGALKWRDEYDRWFKGKKVVIIPDNDEAGEKHAQDVARHLFPVATAVKIVRLPNLAPKGDVSDWIASSGTREQLARIIRETPRLARADLDSWQISAAESSQPFQSFPKCPCLADEAFFGLAGEIVKAIGPYTEADRASIISHLLTSFGNIIGPQAHFRISNDRHPARLNIVIVGDSAKARKGTTWGPIRDILTKISSPYVNERVRSGLSTGEGLIYHVRDRSDGDPGVTDNRILCIEEKFSSMLAIMSRPGNSLSGVVRKAWDSGNLSTLTRNSPLRATGAHVSIIGHTTRDELLRQLSATEQANGFANRFL